MTAPVIVRRSFEEIGLGALSQQISMQPAQNRKYVVATSEARQRELVPPPGVGAPSLSVTVSFSPDMSSDRS